MNCNKNDDLPLHFAACMVGINQNKNFFQVMIYDFMLTMIYKQGVWPLHKDHKET